MVGLTSLSIERVLAPGMSNHPEVALLMDLAGEEILATNLFPVIMTEIGRLTSLSIEPAPEAGMCTRQEAARPMA